MRDWWIDGETGLPLETAEKIKRKIVENTAELREKLAQLEQENVILKQKIAELEEKTKLG